jgi:cyanophycinase
MKSSIKLVLVSLTVFAFACTQPESERIPNYAEVAPSPSEYAGGNLVIVGGGPRPESIMNKIVELSADSSMLIIPMASSIPDTVGWEQRDQFYGYGAKQVDILMMDDDDKNDPAIAEQIRNARGIWFSGGDQNRLMEYLGDGILIDAILEAYENGAVISGTSAGAAVMSRVMITGDEVDPDEYRAFDSIRKDNIVTSPGIGLLTHVIIDQHFIRRSRMNRLISALIDHPEKFAAGIDEATALWVRPGGYFEVIGESQVVLLGETASNEAQPGQLHGTTGMQLFLLPPGSTFRITGEMGLTVTLAQVK